MNPSIRLQLEQTGDENDGPQGRYLPARCGIPNLIFVEPAPPGEDKDPSPDHKAFDTFTIPTNRGRKRRSPRSTPPCTVWKPQPHCMIVDWLGFVEPAPIGEDKVSSPDQKSFRTCTTPTSPGRKRWSPGSILPRTVWKPKPGDRGASATRG